MSTFVPLVNYGSVPEAELNAEILRSAGISALLQGPQAGLFGAGFSGASSQGVTVLVPAEDIEDARNLLGIASDSPEV